MQIAEVTPETHWKVLSQLQRQRRRTKAEPLILDRYLQETAEKKAYKLLRNRLTQMKKEAQQRRRNAKKISFAQREQFVFGRDARITIKSSVTHIGLYVLPAALGGGGIILTARRTG